MIFLWVKNEKCIMSDEYSYRQITQQIIIIIIKYLILLSITFNNVIAFVI